MSRLLRRHYNVQPNAFCVLCERSIVEDIDHLFFDCDFAKVCWQKLGVTWQFDPDICNRELLSLQHSPLQFVMEVF
jgi:hypothetical protein